MNANGNTFSDDSIILEILERNLGKNNAEKVFKTLSGTFDADSIVFFPFRINSSSFHFFERIARWCIGIIHI